MPSNEPRTEARPIGDAVTDSPDSVHLVAGVVVSGVAAGQTTVTQCKHESVTRIGNSSLVKCLQCGKCKYVDFREHR